MEEIKKVIKLFQKNKTPGDDGFSIECYKAFLNGNRSFRLQVDSPTSRSFRLHDRNVPKSFRLHDLSRFAYIEVDSPTLNTYY